MEFPKTSGIYLITNTVNGRCYVGQSYDMRRRKDVHIRDLNRNAHCNKHLQSAWNKYGKDAFEFSVLAECPIENLNDEEVYYIAELGAFINGYNMNIGGGSGVGYRHTEEARRKMSESHPDMSGDKNPMFGHAVQEYMTEDEIALWKLHISQSMSGDKNHFYGKEHTPESRAKISKARKGKLVGADNPMYGKTHTPEAIAKMKAVLKDFYARNRGANNANAVSVVCLNTGEVFGSMSDACAKYGMHYAGVSMCCSSDKSHSAGEFNGEKLVWAYYGDYIQMSQNEVARRVAYAQKSRSGENHRMSKPVVCLTTGEIFESAGLAAKHYTVDVSSICKCCRGQLKSCGKHPESGEKLLWAFNEGNNANHNNICEVAELK